MSGPWQEPRGWPPRSTGYGPRYEASPQQSCGSPSVPGPPSTEPAWTWTATWDKLEPEWAEIEPPTLWAMVWRRMAAHHRYISPPHVERAPGPHGAMTVRSTWSSSPVPVGEPPMHQGPGTYQAWYKAADRWHEEPARPMPPAYTPPPQGAPPRYEGAPPGPRAPAPSGPYGPW